VDHDGDKDILFGNVRQFGKFFEKTDEANFFSFVQAWNLIYINELVCIGVDCTGKFYATPYFTENPFANNDDTHRINLHSYIYGLGFLLVASDGQDRMFYNPIFE